jgi:hypothetical protein
MEINLGDNQNLEFQQLPLKQVAFIISFAEIYDFSTAYFGLYWAKTQERFPRSFDLEPNFTSEDITLPPLRRVAFVDENDQIMIQIQNNSFIGNFKIDNLDNPLNFEAHLQRFLEEWNFFQTWCLEQFDCSLDIVNCELFISTIFGRENGWVNFQESARILQFFNESWSKKVTNLQDFLCQFIYTIPNNQGLVKIRVGQLYEGLEEDNQDKNETSEAIFCHLIATSIEFKNLEVDNYEQWYTNAYACLVKHLLDLINGQWRLK